MQRTSGGRRRPAIHDVARLAGVSHQTVSRVLNGHPKVSDGARQRVRAAITELGYRPSWAARALVTGRTDTIGVVTVGPGPFGTAATLTAFEQAATAADLDVQLASVPGPDPASVRRAADRLLDHGVAGLAVLAPVTGVPEALADLGAAVPLVVVGGDAEQDLPVVQPDQVAGARAATQHLLAAGHPTVWHVAGPAGWFDSRERARGWLSALRDAGIAAPPVVTAAGWDPAAGYVAVRRLCRTRGEITAVFVASDCLALGVLRALREEGVAVPDDVALVGFDDVPEAAFFAPPLTTVRPDHEAVARETLDALVGQLGSGRRPRRPVLIPPELVVRDSAPATPAEPAPG